MFLNKITMMTMMFLFFTLSSAGYCENVKLSKPQNKPEKSEKSEIKKPLQTMSLDGIIAGVEKRYGGPGFTARFTQTSTIKAMDITDTAEGKVFIKRPGMMRWEYEIPERQIILTDGDILWIFRTEDNQVMTGKAPAYFGDGKGASFLSNIRVIRDKFIVSLEKDDNPAYYRLKLIPKEKKLDIAYVYLSISKSNFNVEQIITYNSYEDETLIQMSRFQFNQNLDDDIFSFKIPEGADVLQLED